MTGYDEQYVYVKPVEEWDKDTKPIGVYPVDAKEYLQTGNYIGAEHVPAVLQGLSDYNLSQYKNRRKKAKGEEASALIGSMSDKQLSDFYEQKKLSIPNFDVLTPAQRREEVLKTLGAKDE